MSLGLFPRICYRQLTIDMDNAAFEDREGVEASRILYELARKLEDFVPFKGHSISLQDINGNKVGEAKVTR